MHTSYGFTRRDLIAVVVGVAVLVLLAGMLLPALSRAREDSTRMRCRRTLHQLAAGMATYLSVFGDGAWYACPLRRGIRPDDYNGAEWLTSLYWTGIVADPEVFICGSSPDSNDQGRDLGTHHAVPGRFGSQTVSYAALHHRSLTGADASPKPGALPVNFAANPAATPMASDDTQGSINHGTRDNGYMSVLFFDHHVEGKASVELDVERAVGQTGGLLWRLRN